MVLWTGSTSSVYGPHHRNASVSQGGTAARPIAPQPDRWVALHVRSSNAVRPLRVPTYTVWVRGLKSTSTASAPTATVGAAPDGQSPWSCPLHVALSISETVLSSK